MKISKLTGTLIIIIILLVTCLVITTGSGSESDKYSKEKREIDSLSLLILENI